MTQREADTTEIEAMVREALSGVAVTAFARGIALSVHIDARLPVRVTGDAAAVADYLCRGLARTLDSDHVTKAAFALWRGNNRAAPILLEACRTLGGEGHAPERLADLWALPLGDTRAEPQPHRREGRTETVMVPLPLQPATDALRLADRSRAVFKGRYMLLVGDVPFDPERLLPSLETIGLEIGLARSPEAALEAARRRVEAGKAVDFLLIDGPSQPKAEELARAFRDDPRLAGTLIALAGIWREEVPPPGGERLFDAVRSATRPWRRMIDVFRDLLERRGDIPRQPAACGTDMPDLAGLRILIAEDVETNRALLAALLEPTGAAIEAVSGGEAAIERHAARPADVILMDLQMPGTGGLAAAERIRALPPPAGEAAIIALTAHAGGPDRQRARAAGMDAFLAKPVDFTELYDLLARLAARHGLAT